MAKPRLASIPDGLSLGAPATTSALAKVTVAATGSPTATTLGTGPSPAAPIGGSVAEADDLGFIGTTMAFSPSATIRLSCSPALVVTARG
ncbi:hypothetical protein AB0K67_07890 [Nonomuraea sp. NPDC052634]|uniref:hypothetical protein n=1 Tax=Nonomuraea sp. NPDC052634 TaxID=3155813 RepID=UPI003430E9EF